MKKLFIALLLACTSTYSNANIFEPISASKFTGSIDKIFFENCKRNLEAGEGNTQKCKVFEAPAGSEILVDAGYIGSLQYIANWSYSRCGLESGHIGRMYLKQTSTEIYLIMNNSKCLDVMNKALAEGKYPFKNKSIYLNNN